MPEPSEYALILCMCRKHFPQRNTLRTQLYGTLLSQLRRGIREDSLDTAEALEFVLHDTVHGRITITSTTREVVTNDKRGLVVKRSYPHDLSFCDKLVFKGLVRQSGIFLDVI